MSLALGAVQAAVYDAIKTLAGGRVYDRVPDNAAYPYIQIAASQMLQSDPQGRTGGEEYLDLQVVSRGRGWKEAQGIADQIHDALNGATLTIPGRSSAYSEIDRVATLEGQDGVTFRVLVTVKIMHFS